MAIGLIMEFTGVDQAQYDRVLQKLGMELGKRGDFKGGRTHLAGPADGAWMVVDVWDSQEDFDRFLSEKLGPALAEVDVPEPKVIAIPVYNHFSDCGTK